MIIENRQYQAEAIQSGVDFFNKNSPDHGLIVLPTGSGKSVVTANVAMGLEGNTIVLQPSKEILTQNFNKYLSYGYRASIYSASMKQKHVDKVTFATIGSVYSKKHLFSDFRNVIVDECHTINATEGMYKDFISGISNVKVLGLTATPYRLRSVSEGSMLEFLTRSRPRVFNKMLYYVQNDLLFDNGYLAPLEYFSFNNVDRGRLEMNAKGTDFTAESLREYYQQINMTGLCIRYTQMILKQRRNVLVFCASIEEAKAISSGIPGSAIVSGNTAPETRDAIIKAFTSFKISCLINVKVLDTGFDFPGLEAVLFGKSTMSLALYYQVVGRVMRKYTYPDGTKKTGWVVDLGGNIECFGKIETMRIEHDADGYYISNIVGERRRQLTDVSFSKN